MLSLILSVLITKIPYALLEPADPCIQCVIVWYINVQAHTSTIAKMYTDSISLETVPRSSIYNGVIQPQNKLKIYISNKKKKRSSQTALLNIAQKLGKTESLIMLNEASMYNLIEHVMKWCTDRFRTNRKTEASIFGLGHRQCRISPHYFIGSSGHLSMCSIYAGPKVQESGDYHPFG